MSREERFTRNLIILVFVGLTLSFWGGTYFGTQLCDPPPKMNCLKNHVVYDSQGRPKFTEWCDTANGKCYIIIDGKSVMQKYLCQKNHGK